MLSSNRKYCYKVKIGCNEGCDEGCDEVELRKGVEGVA